MDTYNLAFQGELLPGCDAAEARHRFADYFHIDDPHRAAAFFSGRRVLLRRNLGKDDAAAVFVAMRRIGLVTHIEKVVAEQPASSPLAAQAGRPQRRRRKRQPGAPNPFDLKLSARAMQGDTLTTEQLTRAQVPLIAAVLCLAAMLLLLGRMLAGASTSTQAASSSFLPAEPVVSLDLAGLAVLAAASLSLLALGAYRYLGARLAAPDTGIDEAGFDVTDSDIIWLDPSPGFKARLRLLGLALAVTATAALAAAFVFQAGLWLLVAIALVTLGCSGCYLALWRSCQGHLGALDDRLILVDHRHTYRVGSGHALQHHGNFVMVGDVVVYLGNRLVPHFDRVRLRLQLAPLLKRGTRVDWIDLHIRLIKCRHPLWLGISGLLASLSLASLMLLAA